LAESNNDIDARLEKARKEFESVFKEFTKSKQNEIKENYEVYKLQMKMELAKQMENLTAEMKKRI
jgi:hypothetical protein